MLGSVGTPPPPPRIYKRQGLVFLNKRMASIAMNPAAAPRRRGNGVLPNRPLRGTCCENSHAAASAWEAKAGALRVNCSHFL